MPLGILIDKDLQDVNQVFIPIFSSEDSFLFDYAQKLIFNNNSKIEILDVNGDIPTNFVVQSAMESLENKYPNNINLMEDEIMQKEFLASKDIMIISLESWKSLVDSQSDWLSGIPSVLILKP
jgi:hypothetical protein